MVAGLQAEKACVHGLQGVVMLHFSGNKGLGTQLKGAWPFIAAGAGADGHTGDALAAAHGADNRVQGPGHMVGQLLGSHGEGQVACAEVAFAGDVHQPQTLGQHIVDAAGGAVQIGVGTKQVHAVPGQHQNHLSFIAGGQHLLDGGEHDGVMGDNQVCPQADSLGNDGRRDIHGKENAADFRCRVAHQHAGIVRGHLRFVGRKGVDKVVDLLHGQHMGSSNLAW